MVQHLGRGVVVRVLTIALAVALAFAVGVAVTLLIATPSTDARDTIGISWPEGEADRVHGPGPGRAVSDLTIVDARWGHIACPPGKRPGAGGDSSVICVAGAP
jgi:hypothetical protein